MLKKVPKFKSDAEAENFVDTADLTEYDLSDLVPVKFEFVGKLKHYENAPKITPENTRHKALQKTHQ